MTDDSVKSRRFVGVFLLGCILFNFPILSLFNLDIMVAGAPLLYMYLFGVWGGLILLSMLISRFTRPESDLDSYPKRESGNA